MILSKCMKKPLKQTLDIVMPQQPWKYLQSRGQFQQAIFCYTNAVQHNSTYSLALTNLGFSYLKIGKYKNAFNAFSRAKVALPNNNNNLSQANKVFLRSHLAKFDSQGEKWNKTGSISDQEKQTLKALIQQFEKRFKSIQQVQSKIEMPTEKIMNDHVLEIVKLINQDKFQLKNLSKIFDLVKVIFHEDEEYFHIIPLLIIQNFIANVFQKKKPIIKVELQLRSILKNIYDEFVSTIEYAKQTQSKNIESQLSQVQTIRKYPNLFKDTSIMSKQVKYSLTANCQDISQLLKQTDEEDKKIIQCCANYVFKVLIGEQKPGNLQVKQQAQAPKQ